MEKMKAKRLENLLKAMDEIVREDISDENIFGHWIEMGLPDGYDFKEEPAWEKDDYVADYVKVFLECIKREHKRNGAVWGE